MRTASTAVVTAVAAALILSACGSDDGDASSTSATPTASAEASASPSPSASKSGKAGKAGKADDKADDDAGQGATSKTAAEIRADDAADQVRTESPEPKAKKTRRSAPDSVAAAVPGRYVDYDAYESNPGAYAGSKVVIFFHAPWCPKCRDTEDSINTAGVPDGLTIVKADFDSSTDLRRRYGVTVQHTYVQVDSTGNSLQKWTGTYGDTSVAGIAARV